MHYDEKSGNVFCRFHVDPRFPNRWREPPYYATIKRMSLCGLRGELDGQRFQTVVSIKGKWTIILPHRECEYQPGIVLPFGDHFEFVACKNDEAVKGFDEFLRTLQRAGQRARDARPDLVGGNPMALLEIAINDPEMVALIKKG